MRIIKFICFCFFRNYFTTKPVITNCHFTKIAIVFANTIGSGSTLQPDNKAAIR